MPRVKLKPKNDVPVPYDDEDEKSNSLLDELEIAGNTAELQASLGAVLEVSEEDAFKEAQLLESYLQRNETPPIRSPLTALAASQFLRTYGANLAIDVASLRAAITNKLMEIADCGDPKYELRALELLGKHSDVGLFTERSELTVHHKTSADLEEAIKERVKRLLNADVIDVTPLNGMLDDELGVAGVDYPITNSPDEPIVQENTVPEENAELLDPVLQDALSFVDDLNND
jgi:hypothetical protein